MVEVTPKYPFTQADSMYQWVSAITHVSNKEEALAVCDKCPVKNGQIVGADCKGVQPMYGESNKNFLGGVAEVKYGGIDVFYQMVPRCSCVSIRK